MSNNDKSLLRQMLKASMIGIHLVVATFVGFFIGFFLDKLLGTKPWLTIIFFIFGVVAGFRDIFRMAMKEDNNGSRDDKKD